LNFVNGDYQYLPLQYRCWISFENIRGLLLATTIIYICPLLTILFISIYIIRYVRQTNQIRQRQQRDLIVIKRISIFILVLTCIGLPTVSILFIWIISGKLIPIAYHIQGLSMSIGLFFAAICFAFITPQIQEIFNQRKPCVCSPVMIRGYQEAIQQETEELV